MKKDTRMLAGRKDDCNDHELLIRIDERVQKLDQCMVNHLRHHWAVTVGLVLAAAGAVFSAVLALLYR